MAERIYAHCNSSMLKWARENAGLSLELVAGRLGTTLERMSKWELGEAYPTIGQLRRLASIYKRPLSIFYLDTPPNEPPPPTDFRRLPVTLDDYLVPKLRLALRRAYERRLAAISLYRELGRRTQRIDLRAAKSDDSERVGDLVRRWLHITDTTPFASPQELYKFIRERLEAKGILTFQFSGVPREVARGFSIPLTPMPVIGFNGRDGFQARSFTLLHELAHIAIRQDGICEWQSATLQSSPGDRVESFCNRVAAASLLPKRLLEVDPSVLNAFSGAELSDNDLEDVAKRFFVSKQVVLIRLSHLGLVDELQTNQWLSKLKQEESTFVRTPRRSTPEGIAIARNGRLFSSLVVDGYAEDRLTLRDLSAYLDLGLDYFDRFIARLNREAA